VAPPLPEFGDAECGFARGILGFRGIGGVFSDSLDSRLLGRVHREGAKVAKGRKEEVNFLGGSETRSRGDRGGRRGVFLERSLVGVSDFVLFRDFRGFLGGGVDREGTKVAKGRKEEVIFLG
jgi:hypothetical protein